MARRPIQATLPTPANAPDTGDADADAAIAALQTFPKNTPSQYQRPRGEEYEALVKRAEAVGPERLVPLLDDATLATGGTAWDDEQVDALPAKERREFNKRYKKATKEVPVRLAYLHWLVGTTCRCDAGLERAIAILGEGTPEARSTTADALFRHLEGGAQRRRVGEAFDLRQWEGETYLEPTYRLGVRLLCEAATPAEVFERYAEVLQGDSMGRRSALLGGLAAAEAVDPRWAPGVLASLAEVAIRNQAAAVLKHLEPDASWVEPLCAALPNPAKPGGFWNKNLLEPLARAADERALPWLLAALERSSMVYEPCFEGLRRIGNPATAHAVRDFIARHENPARTAAGQALIAELEKGGAVARPEPAAEPEEPTRERPVLVYARGPKAKHPSFEPLEELSAIYAKAFEEAGLGEHFETLAQRAVLMLPERVKEETLPLGATKLGGHPDLPAKTKWPRVKKEPLTFLAQIDLATVAPLLPKGALPPKGLLSFFLANDPEGEAGYCERAKVLFTKAGAKLVRREVPEDFADLIYQAAKVALHPTVTLPAPTNKHLTKVLRGKKRDAYEDEVYAASGAMDPLLPQLLGFRRHGWDAEEPGTSEMLLQLPGDEQTGMEFGDADVLGIYIARERLEAKDFSRVRPRLGDG